MMRYRFLCGLAAISIGLTIGCGPAKLSRSGASKLIESSDEFKKPAQIIPISDSAVQEGFSQGLWHSNGRVTNKGKEFFSAGPYGAAMVGLAQPLRRRIVDVTGITDAVVPLGGQSGGTIKEAQFIWEFVEVPAVPKRFIFKGGTGTALFRLYDDGWRAEQVELKYSKAPFELTDEEKKAAEADRTAVSTESTISKTTNNSSDPTTGIDDRLEKLDNEVRAILAQIEDAYQRRADILPSLDMAIKAMEANEKEIIAAALDARAAVGRNRLIKQPIIDPDAFQRYLVAQGSVR